MLASRCTWAVFSVVFCFMISIWPCALAGVQSEREDCNQPQRTDVLSLAPVDYQMVSDSLKLDFFGSTPGFNLTFRLDGEDTLHRALFEFERMEEIDPENMTIVRSYSKDLLPSDYVTDFARGTSESGNSIVQTNMTGTIFPHPDCISGVRCPTLQAIFTMFSARESFQFAQESINIERGGVKMELIVRDWNFLDPENELRLVLRTLFYDLEFTAFRASTDEQTGLLASLEFTFQPENVSYAFDLQQRLLRDGEPDFLSDLTYEVVSVAPVDIQVIFNMGHFANVVHYDPDVSILLSQEDTSECSEEGSDSLEALWALLSVIVVPVGFCALCCCAIGCVCLPLLVLLVVGTIQARIVLRRSGKLASRASTSIDAELSFQE